MVVLVDAENLVDKSNTQKNLQFIYFPKNGCFPNKTDNISYRFLFSLPQLNILWKPGQ